MTHTTGLSLRVGVRFWRRRAARLEGEGTMMGDWLPRLESEQKAWEAEGVCTLCRGAAAVVRIARS
ncbi:hypothetical protein ColLi_10300 [Colletotrichum liriopes]|uniref:Uncharacterized protein n=1 Tax=Colletotrichum liriopes TaxID=708192 RepID=A0AA37LWU2_9PEZI|nr:hypothetical protein ColLi_10300 [Colletotrichum liriopes]